MFTVKFVGGAKKSFPDGHIKIDESDMSIDELIVLLLKLKPADTPKLDTDNILIAINGADSSAMDGRSTKIKDDDLVTIIPIIHGGASKKFTFEFSKKTVQVMEIGAQKSIDAKFIDDLRKRYPKLAIQAVSSSFVLDNYHLKKIISISIKSDADNILLSNKLETDILMRFALTTQISDAIKHAGLKPMTNFILIAIGNKKTLCSLYRELVPISVTMFSANNQSYLMKHFKITKKHHAVILSKNSLADILIEKAAVLF